MEGKRTDLPLAAAELTRCRRTSPRCRQTSPRCRRTHPLPPNSPAADGFVIRQARAVPHNSARRGKAGLQIPPQHDRFSARRVCCRRTHPLPPNSPAAAELTHCRRTSPRCRRICNPSGQGGITDPASARQVLSTTGLLPPKSPAAAELTRCRRICNPAGQSTPRDPRQRTLDLRDAMACPKTWPPFRCLRPEQV